MRTFKDPFSCTKNETIDFEKNKFNERFSECPVFFHFKRLIKVKSQMYKVTK